MDPQRVALAVEILGLRKRYGSRVAINDVSCQIPEGAFLGLLGANGAGKSTLLRAILGLTRPTSGKILVFGRSLWPDPTRVLGDIGGFVDLPAFYPNVSVRHNLELLADLSRAPKARVDEMLGYVGLKDRASDKVRVLSRGMRQRLGIAASLLKGPRLLVLDEPADGLDPARVSDMRRLMERIRQDFRTTIIVSSHLLSDVERICDMVAVMDQGHLVYFGPPQELGKTKRQEIWWEVHSAEQALKAFHHLGVQAVARSREHVVAMVGQDADLGAINRELIARGVTVRTVFPRQATLEERLLAYLEGQHDVDIG